MRRAIRVLASVAIFAVSAAAAQAATFKLDNEWTGKVASVERTSDGITMSASGQNWYGGKSSVKISGGYGLSVGRHFVNWGESVVLKFSEKVRLTGFEARFANYSDRYTVSGWDMATGSWDTIAKGRLSGWGGAWSLDHESIDSHYASDMFKITSNGWKSKFKLTEVSAVSAIPLPAGAVLLLSGLGLLALRRRAS